MSFYGFDNQDDFNEYRLLKESEDDSDDRTTSRSSESREESSPSYRTGSYRSSEKSSKVPLTPEEEKERQMKEEQARLEKKLQGKKGMDIDTKIGLINLFLLVVLCISIAAGYYWESYSIVVKQALHLQVSCPEYVFDDCYPQEEVEIEFLDVNTEDEIEQEEVGTEVGSQRAAQVQKSSRGSYGYSSTRYSSNDWDDDDDDDDTWYRGDDDPDEYYEYDYHE